MITLYIFRISKNPDRPSSINALSEIFCLGISHFSPTLAQTFFSLICLSSLAVSIHLVSLSISLSISLVHPSFSPPFCHSSLPCPFFFFAFSLFSPSAPPVPLLLPPFLAACSAWSFHLVGAYCWLHICCGVNFTSVNGWQERLITPRSPSPWL